MRHLNPGRDIVPGRFNLVVHCRANTRFYCADFATLDELAIALREHEARWYPLAREHGTHGDCPNQFDIPLTYGPRRRALDSAEVAAHGVNLRARRVPLWFFARLHAAGYVRRRGPVQGIHKHHHYRQFRRPSTTCERRLAALVVYEEGEVAARPARTGSNLPDCRDDYSRHRERCWKAQGKRSKAWDVT